MGEKQEQQMSKEDEEEKSGQLLSNNRKPSINLYSIFPKCVMNILQWFTIIYSDQADTKVQRLRDQTIWWSLGAFTYQLFQDHHTQVNQKNCKKCFTADHNITSAE